MENKKETPEETIERLFKLYSEYSGGMAYKNIEQLIELSGSEGTKKLIISIAKDFHSERLKLSLPSEEEVIKGFRKLCEKHQVEFTPKMITDAGALYSVFINLLTKGENK
jgi:hypothetical protein